MDRDVEIDPFRPAPTWPGVRLLLCAVGAVSLITAALAVEVLLGQGSLQVRIIAWAATVAVPAMCVVTVRTYRARDRVARATLRASRRLSAVLSTTADVVWETTTDGVITYANDRALDLLGYRPHEVVGQRMALVLAPQEHERACALLRDSLASGDGWTRELFTMRTFDGWEKDVYSSALIHLDDAGQPIGFTGTLREVRLDQELEDELDRIRTTTEAVLHTGAMRSVFQPIISLASGAVIGAEALTRFTADPPQPPDAWFEQARAAGLGSQLELMAIETALAQAHLLPSAVYVSVNVSPACLITGHVHQLLRTATWPCSRIVVEITEHVSVDDYAALAGAVADLRTLGVRVAVDDAGAGYASFRHILQLRPDYIKLDRALIAGLDDDPAKRALAGAFVTFGREVGATIIAEGVETADELRAARALGMHAAQGYYTGRPSPADRLWGVGLGAPSTAAPERFTR